MSIPNFSVKNSVLVNMMMWIILLGGVLFALTLVKEMFPESRPNKLMILAVYPGVQPEEIEKAVTIKIEESIRDVEGIEKVDSTVQEGLTSTVVTLFNEVKDVDVVLQDVKNKIDSLQDIPDDVEKVTVSKLEPQLPVISVSIYGDGSEAQRKAAARKLRDQLLLLPGITEVQITGTRDDEISVEVRPGDLKRYNVTFDEIATAIRDTNRDVSGGQLKGQRTRIAISTKGEKLRGRDLENIVVKSRLDGSKILLKQVADIRDTFVESDLESYFNDKRGVSCTVYKNSEQDAIQIANVVRAFVAGKQGTGFDPYGFQEVSKSPWYSQPFAMVGAATAMATDKMTAALKGHPDPMVIYEQSRKEPFDHNYKVAMHSNLARFVEGRLDLMKRNLGSGLILVIVSLMLFLNWRVAFWAAVGLPVSFFGTFIIMWAFGVSINLLTMFGLIIVLGIIVDDAIVIGENIFRHVEEGMPPMQAAVKGAEEVMWPVTIAVLTTIAAFAPLFFIKGQIGDFMGQLPLVVLAALSVSLLEAIVILPSHLAHLPTHEQLHKSDHSNTRFARTMHSVRKWQQKIVGRYLTGAYEWFLRLTLRWRYVTLATAIALLMTAGGLVAGGIVDFVFIQKMDSETLICSLEMPIGTTSDQVRDRIGDLLKLTSDKEKMPEVESVQAFIARQYDLAGAGATGMNDQSHLGQLVIELKPADQRERDGLRSSMELLTVLRGESARLPNVNSVTWEAMNGGPGGKDIHIRVAGAEFDELVVVAEKLKQYLKEQKGVFDLDDDIDDGQREVQIKLRTGSRIPNVTEALIGGHVRSAVFGREARRITRNREDVKIMVRYPRRYRQGVHHVESMEIPTTRNDKGLWEWTPIGQLATVHESQSYSTIHRSQQTRSVSVFGEVDQESGAKSHEILAKLQSEFVEGTLRREHPNIRLEFLGQSEEMAKAFGGLKIAFPVALMMIFMLLAGLFRSYVQPMVVMSAIPFGFLGAVVGHWVTGIPLTILSFIGMVALTGIVVNDSLVLVDFINNRMRNGEEPFEASVQGAKLRLRAILLTTLTTVAGLTPLMFETSFQAKFLIPMAVTLTWGLAFATLLTLVLVPTLNMIFLDVRGLFKKHPHELLAEEQASEPAIPEQAAVSQNGDDHTSNGNGAPEPSGGKKTPTPVAGS